MPTNYTDELRSYNKQQLIKLFLEVQQQSNKAISKLINEIRLLKENYKKLESDRSVSKTVSSLLTNQMNNVKNQCWASAQYSRRECLEVVGIPSSAKIKDLEGKVCSVFNRTGVVVNPDDIEACHRLYIDQKKIVKFSKRKLCQQVLREKQELKNVDPSEFDFPEGTDIFINESLCSYYKMLWNKCKKLWEKKSIYTYFTSNGNIRYRIRENGDVDTVTNITDFKMNFPYNDINDLQIISYHYCSLILGF